MHKKKENYYFMFNFDQKLYFYQINFWKKRNILSKKIK